MAVLLTCSSISKSFALRPLFRDISFTIDEADRLGLIGPNGSGKSTLMKILAGLDQPDSGSISVRKLTRVGYVPQEPVFDPEKTVLDIVTAAAAGENLEEADRAARISVTLGRAGFTDASIAAGALSGGWRKRLAIARELVKGPDLLLLDEPTNHLDLDGILWLEKLLKSAPFACVVVSHDRYFLENVASRMAEINRVYPEGLFAIQGNYSEFLTKKDEFLAAQSKYQEALHNKVRREIEWLRRGAKARTSKSRARIDEAGRLIEELADVNARAVKGTAQIDFSATDRKTKRLLTAENIGMDLGGRKLFTGLNLTLMPGMRLGLVGANGSGKTTLLRMLNGELDPVEGKIERADNLRVVYFDQNREQLDPTVSLRRALCPEGDKVIFRDRPVHVAGWAKRFLFDGEQLEVPVSQLSGGERARVLIARLMLKPADVLLLDEPTNDLDIPTLEVLEDNLLDFPGALVLVTHDRYMLDRVSSVVLALSGEGDAGLFADYGQWEQARQSRRQAKAAVRAPASEKPQAASAPRKKLSYIEQREWEQMEERILQAEVDLSERHSAMNDPRCVSDPVELQERYARLQEAQAKVDALYHRWAELEAKLQ